MKTLNDLGLHKKTRKKVEAWLQEWLELFEKQADNKEAWVYRCDFEKNDFFWFTNCKDILEKDPEAKGQENNRAIRSRKRKIMMQLFLKTLLGKSLGLITITCNHCGYRGCWIEALKDGNGHWVFCPKCKKTDIHVFPEGYNTCMNTIQTEIAKKTKLQGLSSPPPIVDETQRMKIDLKCKPLIKEIQAYKYDHVSTPKDTEFSDSWTEKDYKKFKESMDKKHGHIPTLPKEPPIKTIGMALKETEDKKIKCSKCGYKVLKKSFGNYTLDTCDHCYFEEQRQ